MASKKDTKKDGEKDKTKGKSFLSRQRSSTDVASKPSKPEHLQPGLPDKDGPDAMSLKQEKQELQSSLDKCLLKIQERELERDKALDDLAIMTAKAEVYLGDFQEERKDRERLHCELDEIKKLQEITSDQYLMAKNKQLTIENEELRIRLKTSEETIADLHLTIQAMKNDDLLKDVEHKKEIHYLSEQLEEKTHELYTRHIDPKNTYTLKDQLDISEMLCKSLRKEKEQANAEINKLQREINKLRELNSRCFRPFGRPLDEQLCPIDGCESSVQSAIPTPFLSPPLENPESYQNFSELAPKESECLNLPSPAFVFHPDQDETHCHDEKYDKAVQFISLEIGELSEAEKSSLKVMVDNLECTLDEELDNDIKIMCKKMKEMRYEEQIKVKTDIHKPYDPNLECPNCFKKFYIGEIQKFKEHFCQCKN